MRANTNQPIVQIVNNAAGHVFYELGDGPRGVWDTFSIRNIGFAVERQMAAKFKGDPDAMRRKTSDWLARELQVDVERWNELERAAFADFAAILALAPEIKRWSPAEKRGVAEIIRAKVGASEVEYLRLMQGHTKLKETMVRLGSP